MDATRHGELLDLQAALERLQEEQRTLRAALEADDGRRLLLRQQEELARLLAVSHLVVSELDLTRVYELVARQAREIVDAETVMLPVLDEGHERYTYVAADGEDAEAVRGSTFAARVGMCGWVLRHGRSLLFGETSTRWTEEPTPWEAGQQSAVLVPLIGRNGILGGLSALGKRGGGCFTQHDLDILTMFASQVSAAIENARLFHEVSREVDERRQAERALEASRSMLRQVLDTMPHAVFWKDRESVYQGCNTVFARAVGLGSPEAVVGRTDFDLPWPREEAEAYRRDDREVIVDNRPKLGIVELLQQADGRRLWIEVSKVPLHDPQGAVLGVLGVYEDVTAAREAEEQLRASERFSRAILDTIDEGLVVLDREFRVRVANRAFADLHRSQRGCLIGQTCFALAHGRPRPCFEDGEDCPVRRVFEDGRPHTAVHEHADESGQVLLAETKAFPLRDAGG